jgi:type II secretory pathway component PulM
MKPLSTRERKLVAILLLLLLIAAGWALILSPMIDGFSSRAGQRALLRATYERNSRLINAGPALRRQAERLRPVAAQVALGGATIGVARDRLQERLRKDFADAGGELTASEDAPSSANDVHAWVQGRISLADLAELLQRIDATPPYLIIETLRISADSALETGRLDKLDVRLEVSIPYSPAAS